MRLRVARAMLFTAALLPAIWLAWGAVTDALGANPIDTITDHTGTWTLRFLLLTLVVTPLRRLTGWNEVIRFRRLAGLFAFFYGCLHLATYVVLDQFFDLEAMAADVVKRPYITAGVTGFVLMVPLAVTSTAGWIRRLGGRRWQRLHRLVYVSASAGVLHYLWLVKADTTRPLRYAAVLGLLLALRVVWSRRALKGHRRAASAPARMAS